MVFDSVRTLGITRQSWHLLTLLSVGIDLRSFTGKGDIAYAWSHLNNLLNSSTLLYIRQSNDTDTIYNMYKGITEN